MKKQKFRITFKCSEPECLSVFEKVTTNRDLMNPRCPYCKERKKDAIKLMRPGDGAVSDEQLMKEKLFKEYMKTEEFQQSLLSKLMSPIPQSSQTTNKAIDVTADIVMEDYKMGNLPDKKMQPGEVMAPRLDPVRQNMADGMFGGKKKGFTTALEIGSGRARPISTNLNMGGMVRSAMAGAYRDASADPVAVVQSTKRRMPVHIVNPKSN